MDNNPPPVSPEAHRLYIVMAQSNAFGPRVQGYAHNLAGARQIAARHGGTIAECTMVDGHVVDMREVTA